MSVVLEHPIKTNETSRTLAIIRTKRVDTMASSIRVKDCKLLLEYTG